MLQEKILEAARPYLEGRTVSDLVLGIALIGAELDGKNVGVSYMLRDSLPSGCGSFGFARQAIGKDAYEVASLLVDGKDDAQRGLAAAVLSAACHAAPLEFCEDGDETPFGVTIRPGDKLALIGYMAPVAKQFAGKVAETVIFDKGRELAGHDDITPCALQKDVLPTCDIVVVSGTSVVNRTVEDLLAMCPGAREFVLTGTSTPMFPAAYAGSGVTSLAGTTWKQDAKDEIFRTISLGGGIMASRALRSNVCVRV